MKYVLLLTLIGIAAQSVHSRFLCTSTGFFADKASPDCSTYWVCIVGGGNSFVAVHAVCPPNTVFHWELHGCVPPLLFTCPNTPEPTESPTTTTTEKTPTTEGEKKCGKLFFYKI
jgi:Chitin binding Peritrophin-A domain